MDYVVLSWTSRQFGLRYFPEILNVRISGLSMHPENPEFLEGRKSKDEILMEFLNNFDGPRGNNDGTVTWEEFYDYYSDLSMSTPSDEYFVKMMESTWQCPENEDSDVTRQTVKMLFTEVKTRIMQLARNDP